MPSLTGSRSVFPGAIDSFGTDHQNDTGEIVTAESLNKLSDALLNLEKHTLRAVLSGRIGTVTPAITGTTRPRALVKAYTVTSTSGTVTTVAFSLSGFTTAEKALFGGSPLAPSGSIHLQVRSAGGDAFPGRAYHAALIGPLTDFSGDSGWRVVASTLRHGNNDFTIGNGTYVITVMISY